MTSYEQIARAAGFAVRTFGRVQKIARNETDGKYVVSDNGWRYACEDANLLQRGASQLPASEVRR